MARCEVRRVVLAEFLVHERRTAGVQAAAVHDPRERAYHEQRDREVGEPAHLRPRSEHERNPRSLDQPGCDDVWPERGSRQATMPRAARRIRAWQYRNAKAATAPA